MKLYMFWTVPLSIIRSFSLYTQQWYICWQLASRIRMEFHPDPARKLSANLYDIFLLTACEQDQDGVPSWSCSQAVNKSVWHIPLLCVQWKTPDDGQRYCPKHAEFHYKNKFEKLVHIVSIIVRNLTQCMVIWTSNVASCLDGTQTQLPPPWVGPHGQPYRPTHCRHLRKTKVSTKHHILEEQNPLKQYCKHVKARRILTYWIFFNF